MEHPMNTPGHRIVGSLVFLLISFPLGLLSFVVTVTGLAVSLGTIVIWIGLPLLWLTLLFVHGMAELERRSVSRLLGLSVRRWWRPRPFPAQGFLRHFGRLLRDPYTWTSALYMLLKMPLGILNFSLTLTLVLLSATLTVLPLVYLLDLYINTLLLMQGVATRTALIASVIEIHGIFDPGMFARTFVGVPLGIACWILTRYVLTALATGSGLLARALLGPGEADAEPHQDQQSMGPVLTWEVRAGQD
jgi:hypothetical protein